MQTHERPPHSTIIAPLRHLAMVTYAVAPERVRPHVPSRFDLDLRHDGQDNTWAFVSVVMFENQQAGPSAPALRCLRATFPQVNYRAYVRLAGAPGAWFFRVVMRNRQADLQRIVFRAPTFSAPITLRHEWDAEQETYRRYQFDCTAPAHRLHAQIVGERKPSGGGPLFDSAEHMTTFLTMRLDGYFHDLRGRQISHMPVWHERMRPGRGAVRALSSEVLDRLGLVPPAEQMRPYSVLLQPSIDFFGQYPRRLPT